MQKLSSLSCISSLQTFVGDLIIYVQYIGCESRPEELNQIQHTRLDPVIFQPAFHLFFSQELGATTQLIIMPAFFTLEITNYLNVVKKSHTSLPPQGTGITDSSHYGTLNKLSAEVRVMVYMNVLKFERTIKQPHRFLGRHPPMMAEAGKHIEVIDAALLRTCRAVYHDAVGILYGVNRFEFRQPRDIEEFAHVGLGKTSFGFYRTVNEPSHAVQNSPYGRLTMIRSMTLKLSSRNKGDDDELKSVLTSWSDFFYPPEERDQLVGFPALERLVLDLKDWELLDGDAHKLRVSPYFPC